DEVERGGQDRRDDALEQRARGARHLEVVDGTNGRQAHCGIRLRTVAGSDPRSPAVTPGRLTRSTKMSSSELWLVCRSRMATPSRPSAPSSGPTPLSAAFAS